MGEERYRIRRRGQAEEFSIAHIRPEGAAGPESGGSLCYEPGEGFYWELWAREDEPKAVYTHPNDPVHKDSCLELFLDCFPEAPEARYINLEVNSLGTVHCAFGSGRHGRINLLDMGLPQPGAQVIKERGLWRVSGLLPQSTAERLYGRDCCFADGQKLRGNFYKCGDETAEPHWRSWASVGELDFHRPEFFGTLIIETDTRL